MKYNYKCIMSKNGGKMYYKNVRNKWKRISNKVGEKAEKGKRKYRMEKEIGPCEKMNTMGENAEKFCKMSPDACIWDERGKNCMKKGGSMLKNTGVMQALDKHLPPEALALLRASVPGYTDTRPNARNPKREFKINKLKNLSQEEKQKALTNAIVAGDNYDVKIALAVGADPNYSDGWTPLHYASENGHADIVNVLLENGVEVDATDEYGETPLFRASRNGFIEVLNALLNEGADFNVTTEYGDTPLHHASLNGHTKVVEELLERGAEVDAIGMDNKTPEDLAEENRQTKIVELLQKQRRLNVNKNASSSK